jgi:pseudaminic acid biosynthesis-associated methylase
MRTAQEEFWRQDFGRDYTARNRPSWKARVPFWRDILDRTKARAVLEVGCNIGTNLKAMRAVDPSLCLWGCDINQEALQEAAGAGLSIVDASAFDLAREFHGGGFDLVASVGVLIHIAPADIERAMRAIIGASKTYVLAVEYAAETEEEILYRGHNERLWKRPFGQMYQDLGLQLVASGDAPADCFDRCAWWLLKKDERNPLG